MIASHDEGSGEPRPAGPVGAGDPPPPPGAKASSGAVPPTPPPAGGGGEEVAEDLDALLADAQKEKAEYLELAKRTQADFENYRKRMAAEVSAAQVRGKIEVAREVIDAVDNLERALNAGGEGEQGLAEGVAMVLGGLRETLVRNGVEAVEPKDERFDPQWHEALSTVSVEGAESGTVVEVLQKGYKLGEQLIRPARVVVSE